MELRLVLWLKGYKEGPLEGTLNLIPHLKPLYIKVQSLCT